MRFAYADPPYPGMAGRYPEKEEVDHAALVRQLTEEFPDGWALSTGSVQLAQVLAVCPSGLRVGAWVKPYVCMRPGINPFYAWEPLIFTKRNLGRTTEPRRDWLLCSPRPPGESGLLGSKPDAFFHWMLGLIGWTPADEIVDLFPGTGRLAQIVESRRKQLVLERGE